MTPAGPLNRLRNAARAALVVVPVLGAVAFAGCGSDAEGANGKPSKPSAAAYPAVAALFDATPDWDEPRSTGFEPICARLDAQSEDPVAAATEGMCRQAIIVVAELKRARVEILACTDLACRADAAERPLIEFARGMRQLAVDYNVAIDKALAPGACRTALKSPDSDIEQIDDVIDKIPGVMDHMRAGDAGAYSELNGLDFAGQEDVSPCKP
jgi:hypothetical protein